MMKEMTFVNEVIVIATPASASVSAILFGTGSVELV